MIRKVFLTYCLILEFLAALTLMSLLCVASAGLHHLIARPLMAVSTWFYSSAERGAAWILTCREKMRDGFQ